MIRLANRSRCNRMFFDNLLKEIAICINTGAKAINHDIELPSYRGMSRRKEEGVIDMGDNHQAIGFDTPSQMLSRGTLRAVDAMVAEAASLGLAGCGSRQKISDYIKSKTDLTDCHLCALNEMMSLG